MAGSFNVSNTFQVQAGPIPLSQLDNNFLQVQAILCALGTFSNYYVDSGAVNAVAVTVGAPQSVSYTAGLSIDVKIANTNTGPATININALGAKNITNSDGSAITSGRLVAGQIVNLKYDGTNFQVATVSGSNYFPVQPAETNAGVVPSNFAYQQGDIRRYGAALDGVTDDTTALTNWLKVGGNLTFPVPLTAKANLGAGSLVLLSNTTITAVNGATISTPAINVSVLKASAQTNIKITGLAITQTVGGASGTIGLVELNGCTNCDVELCQFSGMQWAGILLRNSSNCTLRANQFPAVAISGTVQDSNCITLYEASNHNKILNNFAYAPTQHGLLCQDPYDVPSQPPTHNLVEGNEFIGQLYYGIANYIPGLCQNGAIAVINPGTIVGGTLYVNGAYTAVPLTGGAGAGATANIWVVGGAVTDVVIVNAGSGYVAGNVLSASNANLGGSGSGFTLTINLGGGIPLIAPGTLVGGTLYTNGQYNNVALTGGSGTGATANITVAGGAVTAVVPVTIGSGYHTADVLSATAASIGGTGSGFTLTLGGGAGGTPINPANSFNKFHKNVVQNILGGQPSNTSAGAGIYSVGAGTGGTEIVSNTARNCSIATAAGRSLPPGAIACSGVPAVCNPLRVSFNDIADQTQFEGIDLVTVLCGAEVIGNTVVLPANNTTGSCVRVDGCNDVSLEVNTLVNNGTGQGVIVYANTSFTNNCTVRGGKITTNSAPAIQYTFNLTGLTNSSIGVSDVIAINNGNANYTLSLNACVDGIVNGCKLTGGSASTQPVLLHNNSTGITYGENIFRGTFTTKVQFNNTNTGSYFGPSNRGVGANGDVANIGTGLVVELLGTASPTAGTWAQGDMVRNTTISSSGVAFWLASAAGVGAAANFKTISNSA